MRKGRCFCPPGRQGRFPLRRGGDFAIMQGATGRCGRQGRAGMFKRMYLEITNVCNLRCAFCPGTQRPRRFMTPEEFRQLATRLRPYGTYLMLHVMGEPLLHPQLAELLDIAGELDFRVCLVTNGTLLPRQLPTLEASPVLHKLSVSLHKRTAGCRSPVSGGCLAGGAAAQPPERPVRPAAVERRRTGPAQRRDPVLSLGKAGPGRNGPAYGPSGQPAAGGGAVSGAGGAV